MTQCSLPLTCVAPVPPKGLKCLALALLCRDAQAWQPPATNTIRLARQPPSTTILAVRQDKDNEDVSTTSRRSFFVNALFPVTTVALSMPILLLHPNPALAKCKDLDSCREIGEQKDAADLAANPIIRLDGGLQYKVLNAGVGAAQVTEQTKTATIAYSISQANGKYMYSQGYGYNKIDAGNGRQMADLGMNGLTVHLQDPNAKEVPLGVRLAMMGMKRGEKRRIEVPPALGFATSDWNPKPTTYRGERQILAYQNRLYGNGLTQPPFPAPTIWDVELISMRD